MGVELTDIKTKADKNELPTAKWRSSTAGLRNVGWPKT